MKIKEVLKQYKLVRFIYFTIMYFFKYFLFIRDFKEFNKLLNKEKKINLNWKERYVCLNDKTTVTSYDTHYVYHTAWAARKLKKISPIKHIDISSSIYFNAITSAFISIDFYDYRPAKITLDSLEPKAADIMNLPFENESISSLSCMHVIEHIGLGRYGDALDPLGDIKAAVELQRVLKVQEDMLIVVPMGKPNINFNAHRVYSYEEVISMFNKLDLKEFSLLTDDDKGAEFLINASPEFVEQQNYGCGCFWFRKVEEYQ